MNQLAIIAASNAPTLVVAAGSRASYRFLEFFTAQIRNPHTRRAYARAAAEFFDWLAAKGVARLEAIESLHVATYIEELQRARSAPTAKLRLAALRRLFDWMVIGQIMAANPAVAVRGPRHVVRRGKTPVLDPAEARQLIDAIDTTTVIGLRDRALIGLMVYSFARIGAAIGMRVEDVYTQNRRLWVRLHEKGGKQHAMPCHHNLETYLHESIDGAALASDPKALLLQSYSRATRPAHRQPPAPGEYLCDDPETRAGGRDHDQDRQPHISGDRRHRLSEERRHARKGRSDGKPRFDPHDAAL
jgi:site-specific recombinase XerC